MFDVEKLLGQMLSGGVGKRGRSSSTFGIPGVSKAQLGVGAIGIAIAAWEHFKNPVPVATAPAMPPPPMPQAPPPPPPPSLAAPTATPLPPPVLAQPVPVMVAANERMADAAHLIRSMIAAANADGVIDAEERSAILERAMEAGLDAATQAFLMGELRAPADLQQIAQATRADLRLETYAAALIAINVDTDAERTYLDRLAAALGLSADDRVRVGQQLGLG
jgi:hypothetical protein